MTRRDPLSMIADIVMITIVGLFAAGGIYAMVFFIGWCILSLYDTLVTWLGA